MRLDIFLTEKGYFSTRSKALLAIKDGDIIVDGKVILKPGYDVSENNLIVVNEKNNLFVSRGGYKLLEAINKFNLDFTDKIVLDVGASTGGFTDCSIQNGAKLVYAVDVGTDQLDDKLRNHPKVISMEQTNIKDVLKLDNKIDYIVMDVSFVSIDQIIPHLFRFMSDNTKFICLIKPQFEAGVKNIGKGGIVKDKKIHEQILENKLVFFRKNNMNVLNLIPSPIKGKAGNIEYLALVELSDKISNINCKKVVLEAFK